VFITTHSTHITSGVPLSSQIVLTSNGGPITTFTKTTAIPDLEAAAIADLERYLDATRSTLLYARKVLLVEGPAEQFVIPPLVKQVLNIDLDEEGIAIVPIYGTHFSSYAKLFGQGGIQKKCAILADGDLSPSDADPALAADEGEPLPDRPDLAALRSTFVEVFACQTTFERELVLVESLGMLRAAMNEIGAPRVASMLKKLEEQIDRSGKPSLNAAKDGVLRIAKKIGKARFAQVVSKHVLLANAVPEYVRKALEWLIVDAPNK